MKSVPQMKILNFFSYGLPVKSKQPAQNTEWNVTVTDLN